MVNGIGEVLFKRAANAAVVEEGFAGLGALFFSRVNWIGGTIIVRERSLFFEANKMNRIANNVVVGKGGYIPEFGVTFDSVAELIVHEPPVLKGVIMSTIGIRL